MKRSILWLLAVVAIQGLAACANPGAGNSQVNADSTPPTASPDTSTLGAYHWQMPAAFNAGKTTLQLDFQGQRLSVRGLCNVLGAGYKTNASEMTVSQVVGTMRMCGDPALMQYEQEVGRRLEKIQTWSIAQDGAQNAPRLTLGFKDGQPWTLDGKPTAQTKYGSAGETVFLEIAPQLTKCQHPLIPNKQCLKVRSIHYNSAGLKTSQGPWQNFHGEIEGYTHQDGIRNVLRVKRYTLANPPADASRYAYVLDMTVESEKM